MYYVSFRYKILPNFASTPYKNGTVNINNQETFMKIHIYIFWY